MKNKIYKIYIDNSEFMELVSEVATQIGEKTFGDDTYIFIKYGETAFSEDAQDYFNDKYTEYEMMFNKIGNIYSNNEK